MKRVVAKRKKASSGAKRNTPRRRSSAKTTAPSKSRLKAVKRKKPLKARVVSSRQTATKRKPVSHRSARPVESIVDELTPSSTVNLLHEDAGAKRKASKAESRPAKRKQPRLEIPPIL